MLHRNGKLEWNLAVLNTINFTCKISGLNSDEDFHLQMWDSCTIIIVWIWSVSWIEPLINMLELQHYEWEIHQLTRLEHVPPLLWRASKGNHTKLSFLTFETNECTSNEPLQTVKAHGKFNLNKQNKREADLTSWQTNWFKNNKIHKG